MLAAVPRKGPVPREPHESGITQVTLWEMTGVEFHALVHKTAIPGVKWEKIPISEEVQLLSALAPGPK
jgi:hypothetical protein